jgi:hypothetical protein
MWSGRGSWLTRPDMGDGSGRWLGWRGRSGRGTHGLSSRPERACSHGLPLSALPCAPLIEGLPHADV